MTMAPLKFTCTAVSKPAPRLFIYVSKKQRAGGNLHLGGKAGSEFLLPGSTRLSSSLRHALFGTMDRRKRSLTIALLASWLTSAAGINHTPSSRFSQGWVGALEAYDGLMKCAAPTGPLIQNTDSITDKKSCSAACEEKEECVAFTFDTKCNLFFVDRGV